MKKWLSLFLCFALLAALPAARAEGALQAQDSDFTNSTVERVKSEILSAQITSSAEVLSVALDHLDADITVDGMTTTILDDGRLQITQILSPDNADEIAAHSGAAAGASDMACSTLLVLKPDGTEATWTHDMSDSGGINEYSVFAVHTAYFEVMPTGELYGHAVRVTTITTEFFYGTAIRANRFHHKFEAYHLSFELLESEVFGAVSTPEPNRIYSNSVYSQWLRIGNMYNFRSYSFIEIGETTFCLAVINELASNPWYADM
ncbi:MAG TPA: hypothetical protein IAB92_03180 [Candidatus Faecousia faecigallinarum]|nr:hypothetical protein [Candidatus Faecousia faecigallinarum]